MKPTTRAEFLRFASLTAAAAVVGSRLLAGRAAATAPTAALPAQPPPPLRAGPSPADLLSAAQQDPVFWVLESGGRRTKLHFEQAQEKPSCERTVQFSMHFAGPVGRRLPEATHSVSHARLGYLNLYLAPSAVNENDPAGYRADFNLLT